MRGESRIHVARVVRPHGVRGEMVVEPLTDFPERFRPGLEVVAELEGGEVRTLALTGVRPHKGRLLFVVAGVQSVEQVEELRDAHLSVEPGLAWPKPEGYWYHFELEGLRVEDRAGRCLGTVTRLDSEGAQPRLLVDTDAGPREIPFVQAFVVSVEPERSRIVLDLPDGLLEG